MEYSPKTKLVLSALLDIATGALALYIGFAAIDGESTGPVQTVVTLILVGLVAGFLRGRSGADNPWVKGLLVSGYALVTFVFFAFWAVQEWQNWHQAMPPMLRSGIHEVYWRLEQHRYELAVTALPLLFVLSSIAGAGLCHLQRPSVSKVVKCALLGIVIGAVFLMVPLAVVLRIGPWPTMIILSVTGLAAGFLRGRSGFANPWVKGLLIGGAALFLFAVLALFTAQHWQLMMGSGSLYDYWYFVWPLLFVLSSIVGAWLCYLQKPSTASSL